MRLRRSPLSGFCSWAISLRSSHRLEFQFSCRAQRQRVPAAADLSESRAAVNDDHAQPARIRIQFFLVQDDRNRHTTPATTQRGTDVRNNILFGQFVIATENFLK